MDLHSQRLNVVRTISSSCEVREVELDLVPSFVESHRHGTNERLYSSSRLIVRSPEASSDVFVVEDLHLESEVLFELGVSGLTFLMIMTRKGSLIPRVLLLSEGQVM